jgi:hypothetical protein
MGIFGVPGVAGAYVIARKIASRCLTPSSPAPEPVGAEGTKAGHENAEGMAGFCVRVQRTVRLRRGVEGF